MEVDVAAGGYLFARKVIDWFVIRDHSGVRKLDFLVGGPVKDVNGAALVDKDFLNGVVFDICSLLYQSHPLVFPIKVKRRCVYMGGNGREIGNVANIFLRFSTSFNMFSFFEREIKKEVSMEEW